MIKNILNSLSICFSMYSIIPTPRVDWDEANMKYVFCFFPLVGAIIGGVEYLWFLFATALSLNGLFYAAVATLIPVILSGGIHIDGFIDTCDAVFSFGDKEKRLQILKDPHVGAFGIIYCIVYFIITLGLFAQLFQSPLLVLFLALIFPLGRALSGIAAINLPSAKSSGLQHLFSKSTSRRIVTATLISWAIGLSVAAIFVNAIVFCVIAVLLLLLFLWFNYFSQKNFGGITGDLVGFSLMLSELIMLVCCVFGGVFL